MPAPTSHSTASITLADVGQVQRHTVATLAGSQVLGGVGVSSAVAVGTLLAADLSGSETFSGLGGTSQTVGGALAALLIARVMASHGRRPGLVLGYLMAVVGAVLVILAAAWGQFALFLIGTLLFGGATAANSQARFAATDLASTDRRGRHLSIVVWATTIGAVAGPNLTGLGDHLAAVVAIPPLAGPYAFSVLGLVAAAGILLVALRPDPLLVARRRLAEPAEPQSATSAVRGGGLAAIRAHPTATLGVLTMALGHAVMVSVMVMTPLHMRHGEAGLQLIGFTISLHIVGMYAFSPVTGWAVDRLGGRRVVVLGSGLLLAATLLAGTAEEGSSWHLTAALIVLGLGWSCTLIAGSTLLTGAVPLRQRTAAQGLADVAMGLAGGGGGALAGVVMHVWGFSALAVMAGAVAIVIGLAVLVLRSPPMGSATTSE